MNQLPKLKGITSVHPVAQKGSIWSAKPYSLSLFDFVTCVGPKCRVRDSIEIGLNRETDPTPATRLGVRVADFELRAGQFVDEVDLGALE